MTDETKILLQEVILPSRPGRTSAPHFLCQRMISTTHSDSGSGSAG